MVRDDGRALALEVKLANTVSDHDTRAPPLGGRTPRRQAPDTIVINTGPNAYRRHDAIGVIPLGLLAP